MPGPLFAITDRIDRAEDHLQVIEGMVRDYFHSDVCRYRGHYDPNTRQHTVEGNITFPNVRLATVCGEMVHDLRSSLDHLARCLVKENGGTPVEGVGGTAWPILKTPPPRGLKIKGGVSLVAFALIERSQPYWTPVHPDYDAFWLLHRLSIIDKHQQIPIQGIAADHFAFVGGSAIPAFTWTSRLVSADERHAELRIVPDDPALDVHGTFDVFVVVKEPPQQQPVLTDTLHRMLRDVRSIVDEARATCFAAPS